MILKINKDNIVSVVPDWHVANHPFDRLADIVKAGFDGLACPICNKELEVQIKRI